MTFVVQCPYCNNRSRVPDRALGVSGKCPRCASFFTLSPAENQKAPACTIESAEAADGESQPVASLAVALAIAEAAASRPVASVNVIAPLQAREYVSSQFSLAALLGAAALLLGGMALSCASIRSLCGYVIPVSVLALLLGSVSITLGYVRKPRRFLMPMTGVATALAVLLVANFGPALLGPTYYHSRQRETPAQIALRAIPLGSAPALQEPFDWVDASQYSLMRSSAGIQVLSVMRASKRNEGDSQWDAAEAVLHVRVRVTRVRPKTGEETESLDWRGDRSPKLTDDKGTPHALQRREGITSTGSKRRADLFPALTVDEVFTFAAPPEGVRFVRLEVPADPLGVVGTFSFTIPATMIVAGEPKEQESAAKKAG